MLTRDDFPLLFPKILAWLCSDLAGVYNSQSGCAVVEEVQCIACSRLPHNVLHSPVHYGQHIFVHGFTAHLARDGLSSIPAGYSWQTRDNFPLRIIDNIPSLNTWINRLSLLP